MVANVLGAVEDLESHGSDEVAGIHETCHGADPPAGLLVHDCTHVFELGNSIRPAHNRRSSSRMLNRSLNWQGRGNKNLKFFASQSHKTPK